MSEADEKALARAEAETKARHFVETVWPHLKSLGPLAASVAVGELFLRHFLDRSPNEAVAIDGARRFFRDMRKAARIHFNPGKGGPDDGR